MWPASRPTRPRHRRRPAIRRRPLLEGMEERCLLSTFTVLHGGDAGPGSLREALALANATPGANAIAFDPGVTQVVLTSGSN